MEKLQVSRAVIVEGKYDQIKLSALIEGLILRTDGFRIFGDPRRTALIRTVAKKQGLVIVTDSDRAGFRLRGYIRSIARDADIVNVYIPQICGKEKRKLHPGAEGLLGVEGIPIETLRALFLRSGAFTPPGKKDEHWDSLPVSDEGVRRIGRMDFYEDGLSGGTDAAARRRLLLEELQLPGYLTANGLLDVINTLLTYEEYRALLNRLWGTEEDN